MSGEPTSKTEPRGAAETKNKGPAEARADKPVSGKASDRPAEETPEGTAEEPAEKKQDAKGPEATKPSHAANKRRPAAMDASADEEGHRPVVPLILALLPLIGLVVYLAHGSSELPEEGPPVTTIEPGSTAPGTFRPAPPVAQAPEVEGAPEEATDVPGELPEETEVPEAGEPADSSVFGVEPAGLEGLPEPGAESSTAPEPSATEGPGPAVEEPVESESPEAATPDSTPGADEQP